MSRHGAAVGAGRPWRFAAGRQMPEFLRWSRCAALSGFRGRDSPLARPGASPRLCGRFSAAVRPLPAASGHPLDFSGLRPPLAPAPAAGPQSGFSASNFRKTEKFAFAAGRKPFLAPPGRINPVMVCHPSRGGGRCGRRPRGFVAGLPELREVALDGTVGHAEDAGDFRHGAAEFGQGRRFPPVVVAGAYGWVNVGARRPALCPRFSLVGSAARRLGGAAGFGGARAAPHCDRSTRGRILVLGLPRGPPAVSERDFPFAIRDALSVALRAIFRRWPAVTAAGWLSCASNRWLASRRRALAFRGFAALPGETPDFAPLLAIFVGVRAD